MIEKNQIIINHEKKEQECKNRSNGYGDRVTISKAKQNKTRENR